MYEDGLHLKQTNKKSEGPINCTVHKIKKTGKLISDCFCWRYYEGQSKRYLTPISAFVQLIFALWLESQKSRERS